MDSRESDESCIVEVDSPLLSVEHLLDELSFLALQLLDLVRFVTNLLSTAQRISQPLVNSTLHITVYRKHYIAYHNLLSTLHGILKS